MVERAAPRIGRMFLLVVVALLILILVSMWLDDHRPMPEVGTNPECPHSYDTTLALPGELTSVPEYHDCQRMINLDDETYGSLIGVFMRSNADSIAVPVVDIPAPVRDPRDPTRVVAPDLVVTPTREPQYRASAVALAEIKNWDSAYAPLGIAPNLNCLYVTKVRYTGTNIYWYMALMVPLAGSDDTACLPQGAPAQGGKWLRVVHSTLPEGAEPFPAVARWDRDETNHKNYVSMLCGRDWCEVGDDDLRPVPNRDVTAGTAAEQLPWEQKGRYDEQRLAVMNPQGLRPSTVLATAAPHPDLGSYTDASFDGNAWKPVASTALPGELPPYVSKFNFGMGGIVGARNEVSLCRGTRFRCLPFLSAMMTMYSVPCWKSEDGEMWWARIDGSTGTTRYRCTTRRTHGMGKSVPAAARWRWKANDEGLWTRCAAGCCEVYGDE